jgi:hypothetical protein
MREIANFHSPHVPIFRGFSGALSFPSSEAEAMRRPPNAFILFSRAARPSVQTQHPGLNNIESTKILAQMWNAMADDHKVVFKHMAAELQSDFKNKNPNYGYRKTIRREPARPEPRPPAPPQVPFTWEQMLNHHENQTLYFRR